MVCSSLKRFLFRASPPAITAIRKTHLLPGPILGEKLTQTTRPLPSTTQIATDAKETSRPTNAPMLASPMSWFGLQHRGLAHHRKAVILIAPERTEYPISSLNRVLRIVRLLVDGLHPQARERKELQVTRAPRAPVEP
jgi:hypothetical protein